MTLPVRVEAHEVADRDAVRALQREHLVVVEWETVLRLLTPVLYHGREHGPDQESGKCALARQKMINPDEFEPFPEGRRKPTLKGPPRVGRPSR